VTSRRQIDTRAPGAAAVRAGDECPFCGLDCGGACGEEILARPPIRVYARTGRLFASTQIRKAKPGRWQP
jgi:hypothetical protein